MKKLLCGAIAFGLMGSMGVAQAASISGTTNFRVTIPEILVLYHWDEAHLILTAAGDFVYSDNTTTTNPNKLEKVVGSTTANFSSSDTDFTGSPVSTTDVPGGFDANNEINVTLEKAWAVRSISSADVKLKLETQGNSELKNGASIIKISVVSDKALECHADNTTNCKPYTGGALTPGQEAGTDIKPGWKPTFGNIKFGLNLSGVTKAGVHTSDTVDTFKLTLTGAP